MGDRCAKDGADLTAALRIGRQVRTRRLEAGFARTQPAARAGIAGCAGWHRRLRGLASPASLGRSRLRGLASPKRFWAA